MLKIWVKISCSFTMVLFIDLFKLAGNEWLFRIDQAYTIDLSYKTTPYSKEYTKNINYFHFKLILLIDLLNITVYYQNEIHHMKRIYCCCIRFMNITFYGNEIRKWVEACVCHIVIHKVFDFEKKNDYRRKIWMHYSYFFFLQKFYPNLLKHLFSGAI